MLPQRYVHLQCVGKANQSRVQLIALDVDAAGEDMEMHGLMWYPATGTPRNPMISYRVSLAQQASPAAAALVTPTKNAHGLIDSIRVAARARGHRAIEVEL